MINKGQYIKKSYWIVLHCKEEWNHFVLFFSQYPFDEREIERNLVDQSERARQQVLPNVARFTFLILLYECKTGCEKRKSRFFISFECPFLNPKIIFSNPVMHCLNFNYCKIHVSFYFIFKDNFTIHIILSLVSSCAHS